MIGLLAFSSAGAFAQNIDANRMNRDIRIMENILAELFKTTAEIPTAETIVISQGYFRQRSIRGTYLNDYGIIFMVPQYDQMRPRLEVAGQGGYSFYYNSDDENTSREVDEQSVVSRITEFLMDYGSTIGQLKDDENLMVIYGSNANDTRLNYRVVVSGADVSRKEQSKLPVISVSAKVKDLRDYRSGRIDAAKMKERIKVSTTEDKVYTDLKVMGNIFETALNESGESSFRVSRTVSQIMLDNFGVIFSFDAHYSDNSNERYRTLDASGALYRAMQETQRRGRVRINNELSEEDVQKLKEEEQQLIENINAAFENFKTTIAEYLVDYGRTLNSIGSDQYILTSVTIQGRIDGLPERVDFQIKKSVLENLDRGKTSREDAIKAVSITEY